MYLWPAYIRRWNGMNKAEYVFWQNWEFFSSVSWQTFELIKTRSCGVQTPTYPTDFHHRWWRLRHTKVRASTKAAGWGFHSEVRVLCEVLGCGFLHLRNLHEELILGSTIVVGSRCSCVAGGVRINFRACFLFRPVVSSSFQIAPILLLLQWIRMSFIIISFYFVALLKLQDNDGFSYESLFPKPAAIPLPLSGWQLHM